MSELCDLSPSALQALHADLQGRYREFQARNLSLDMTRGKPCAEQLDLSLGMLTCVDGESYEAADGTDCRNYGGLDGLPEAKELFAAYLEVAPEEIIIGGASSLQMMHDTVMASVVYGSAEGAEPWGVRKVKFVCPCPGYDRHFSICERLGIEMIPVGMNDDGPDMDAVEALVANDPAIVGMWCVPRYSNPTGVVYSDEVVDRLAAMPTAAPDFRIFWDNAYAVHFLTDGPAPLKNILAACKAAGNPDRVLIFGSTSKVTFAGAGLALVAGSVDNMDRRRSQMFIQTIGPDKLNQLRHVRYLRDMDGILAQMAKHAAIIGPKFDAVQEILTRELGGKGIAEWTQPRGGYFVSLDTMGGCAKEVIERAAQAGVRLTPAGSTYPLKRDPHDSNIRIAPTLPPEKDIALATELLAICIQLVSVEKLTR